VAYVTFFDKQNLKPAAVSELDSMVITLNEFPAAIFEVGGYTDEAGSDDYNIKLGLRRANAAAAYLKAHGISADRIVIKSYGKLISDKNMSKEEAGRWNRKVRMVILSGR
jgi:outer membrane protein OmpA-like peptidoglycan-associated protein